jgi:KDO2-lipid IV(A) lauroyltransferase
MKAPKARSARSVQPRTTSPPHRWRDRWLLALLRFLVRLFERISIDRAIAIWAAVGRFWFSIGGPRTRRVREQLAVALPERSLAEREAIAREVFVHLGQGLAELLLLSGRQRSALLARVEIRGLEHLEAAASASAAKAADGDAPSVGESRPSRGALIVTAHFGNWELAGAKAAAVGIPISVVYRSLRSPALDSALRVVREGTGVSSSGDEEVLEQIPMGRAGIRVVRALDAGRKVVVLLDQDARRQEGLDVSFFGRPASTRYGPIALAALRDVPVLPAFIHRQPDGISHVFQIHPALQLEPGSSDDENVLRRNLQRVTDVIEQEIRASPGQWIWTHRRWRTRSDVPDPEPPRDRGAS